MGLKLYDYYLKAAEFGGIPARTKLSVLTRMTSVEAKNILDTDELLKSVAAHLNTVMSEFSNKTQNVSETFEDNSSKSTEKIRKQMNIFADLTASRQVYNNNLEETSKRITEALSDAIDVARASIWLYNEEEDAIECLDLYERDEQRHSKGVILHKKDFPQYFATVATQRTLAAENALTHYGTKEFAEVYLKPLGINSMLDVPIYVNGVMVGVVCNEHTGPFRKWSTDEETFAYLMGNIVGMTLEKVGVKVMA